VTSSTARLSRRAWTSARKAAALAGARGTLIHWGERVKGGGEEKEIRKPSVTTVWTQGSVMTSSQ